MYEINIAALRRAMKASQLDRERGREREGLSKLSVCCAKQLPQL